jgi:LysR family transcriptional regulator, benzoate and cis,cis-muconate-responsive activator of ben and cat genes
MRIPSLTIDVLVAVITLVEKRTYELAGKELSLSASAVHKRVRAAETVIGQRLFIATEEGMLPTKEGRVFYPDAIRTVEQALLAEEKTRAMIDLDAGRLLVGHSTYLPPKLLAFVMKLNSQQHQGIHIQHFPGLTAPLTRRVVDGTLHAAFGDLPVSHPALLSRQLLEEPVMVCVPKSHPLALQPVVRPQDLNDAPVIAVSREPSPMQHTEIEAFFEGFGVRLNVVADAFGPPEAVSLVEQNVGVSLLGASAAKNPSIVAKPLSVRTLTYKSGVYVREDNRHASLNEFISIVLRGTGQGDNRSQTRVPVSGRGRRSNVSI